MCFVVDKKENVVYFLNGIIMNAMQLFLNENIRSNQFVSICIRWENQEIFVSLVVLESNSLSNQSWTEYIFNPFPCIKQLFLYAYIVGKESLACSFCPHYLVHMLLPRHPTFLHRSDNIKNKKVHIKSGNQNHASIET